ncbi:IS66 family insertion sequence element accessory protein TnpB [Massilia sp. TSP1-1-2]|uniref:IS66 family insertion sequence element accessory protein TnpB n=1 Tax=Massilia sp. TSP1-1-2 TaxID=2804649 RepID=UPI003CF2F842
MQLSADAIWLATAAVDMRNGIDGLSLHVQQALGRSPCDGTAYVFAKRRCTRLKMLCWDGTGLWMCLRRPHHGQFVRPQVDDACWQMSAEQWQWLVAGVDWQRLSAPAPAPWRLWGCTVSLVVSPNTRKLLLILPFYASLRGASAERASCSSCVRKSSSIPTVLGANGKSPNAWGLFSKFWRKR